MKALLSLMFSGLFATLAAANPAAAAATDTVRDVHSYAEPDKVTTRHIHLDLDVDFAAHQLRGSATLSLQRLATAYDQLVLDTRALTISKVEAGRAGVLQPTSFSLDAADPILGSALRITLPKDADTVKISYASSPDASGLQWLTPAQTAGKKHPFMFSQAQAIHARSFIPLQDTPQVRVTYSAVIRTPKDLRAVMSADNDASVAATVSGATSEYKFKMPQPIPSYLIAIAAGDLAFKPMSARTGVWAEPVTLDAAVKEFADTEQMVVAAEKLYGPYAWGRYDLLILPPSFPFGGMENPRLTFATPTVIAGDKSLVSLIAHELAHSWSGNLVTNATWRDTWLNEGFTTYVENRIMEEIYGRDRAVMEQALGRADLLEDFAKVDEKDRVLTPDLTGRDPDENFSRIPYEKGASLLFYLEDKYGRDKFDAFIKGYFNTFKFKTLTTEQFLAYAEKELINKNQRGVKLAKLKEWLYQPGLPSDATQPESPAFAAVDEQLQAFVSGKKKAAALPTKQWTTHEWLRFLDGLPEKPTLAQMQELDAAFKLTQNGNAEIAHAWLRAAIRADYKVSFPRLEQYLIQIGRRKLVIPLYKLLAQTPANKAWAIEMFKKAEPGYHPLTIGSAKKELGLN